MKKIPAILSAFLLCLPWLLSAASMPNVIYILADDLGYGDLQFLTSEGKDRWEGNHTQPNWVVLTGKLGKQAMSLAVFGHPKNFRAPQPVRIHPNKPYFCFAPAVTGKFKIGPGKKYVSRYRYVVTSEAANPTRINEHWQQYAKDPAFEIEKNLQ